MKLCHIAKTQIELLCKTVAWKLVSGPFLFMEIRKKSLLENEIFETSCLYIGF